VARVRENIANRLEPAKALEKAVKECIRDNVLKEFLKIYGSDVVNMLSMEWNLADALIVRYKDGALDNAEKVAEKMLRRGTSIEIVAEDTELPIEQIEKMAQKIQNEQQKS